MSLIQLGLYLEYWGTTSFALKNVALFAWLVSGDIWCLIYYTKSNRVPVNFILITVITSGTFRERERRKEAGKAGIQKEGCQGTFTVLTLPPRGDCWTKHEFNSIRSQSRDCIYLD